MKRRKWFSTPITPIIAGIYPFLFYWSVNANQVSSDDVWRSFFTVLLISIVLFSVLWLISRDINKANVSGTIILLAFFSYGHFYTWLRMQNILIARHSILLPALIIISAIIIWAVYKTSGNLKSFISFLNGTLIVLSLFSTIQISSVYSKTEKTTSETREDQTISTTPDEFPDIYLIVVDEYPRADVLKKSFDFDNSPFLDQLEELGFRIIPCSQSNYRWTIQAVYSMLNLDYAPLDSANPIRSMTRSEITEISNSLKNGLLLRLLGDKGYKIVSFESGYYFLELTNADKYFKSKDWRIINSFESGFLNTTIISSLDDFLIRLGSDINNPKTQKLKEKEEHSQPEYYHQMKRNAFLHLKETAEIEGPKFVYAHLTTIHLPIVIGAEGELLPRDTDKMEGYLGQLEFANNQIIESMRYIFSKSATPPIIILVSDHGIRYEGYGFEGNQDDGYNNLLAVWGPEQYTSRLYDKITPVNVIRLLANYLDLGSFDLLEDISMKPDTSMQGFENVKNSCPVR